MLAEQVVLGICSLGMAGVLNVLKAKPNPKQDILGRIQVLSAEEGGCVPCRSVWVRVSLPLLSTEG